MASLLIVAVAATISANVTTDTIPTPATVVDSVDVSVQPLVEDSLVNPYTTLTEKDYIEVAEELGVEVAVMKAVVEVEAGKSHKGFWSDGHPVINFDLSVYRKMASRRGVNLQKYRSSHPVIFQRPNVSRYGSQQAGQQARLDAAMEIDSVSAITGTFWGMFQIGGFNWKKCGTSSPGEFLQLMSRSERDQLELFAKFVRNSGMLNHLQKKNWAGFARIYNGPKYRSKGYHTRLASAYKKYK